MSTKTAKTNPSLELQRKRTVISITLITLCLLASNVISLTTGYDILLQRVFLYHGLSDKGLLIIVNFILFAIASFLIFKMTHHLSKAKRAAALLGWLLVFFGSTYVAQQVYFENKCSVTQYSREAPLPSEVLCKDKQTGKILLYR